jgi:hypothetical protein
MAATNDVPVVAEVVLASDFDNVSAKAFALSRADKYRLLQVLIADLARGDCVGHAQPGVPDEIPSPCDAHEATAILRLMADEEKGQGL